MPGDNSLPALFLCSSRISHYSSIIFQLLIIYFQATKATVLIGAEPICRNSGDVSHQVREKSTKK